MRPLDRPDPSITRDPAPPLDRVDRAWAATRPADPSPELLDALWAHASAELDRIDAARAGDVLPLPGDRSSRRRRVVIGLALAQAAAVLIAVGIAWRRPVVESPRAVVAESKAAMPRGVPAPTAPAVQPILDVEVGKTAFVRIDEPGHRVDQIEQPTLAADPGRDVAMPHDVFDFFESHAILAEAAPRDGFNSAEGGAIP